jgi:hypothetical protein
MMMSWRLLKKPEKSPRVTPMSRLMGALWSQ